MSEFFNWEILATFTGASVATAILTQFIKKPLAKITTQLVSYIVALIILVLATATVGSAQTWSEWLIAPLNAILVSVAANGEFTAVNRFIPNNGGSEDTAAE